LQNVANSDYHALQATLRRSSGPLTAGLSYTYSHSIDDASDRSDPVLVDSYNLRGNRASSNFDVRHLASLSYLYRIPNFGPFLRQALWTETERSAPPRTGCCSRVAGQMFSGWEISGVTLFQSGTPFTVINSAGNTGISLTDNAGVSSGLGIAASYPDVEPFLPAPLSQGRGVPDTFGPLLGNPSRFVAPRGLTFGDAGRNYLTNPSRLNFDMSILKHFRFSDAGDLEFRAEFFNIFNHTEFRTYDPDNPGGSGNNVISCYAGPSYSAGFSAGGGPDCLTGASFLRPIDAHRPRTIQFGLKWGF
jgi:hypothetical protein